MLFSLNSRSWLSSTLSGLGSSRSSPSSSRLSRSLGLGSGSTGDSTAKSGRGVHVTLETVLHADKIEAGELDDYRPARRMRDSKIQPVLAVLPPDDD